MLQRVLFTALGLACVGTAFGQEKNATRLPAQPEAAKSAVPAAPRATQGEWTILIRPMGYDPANEWEYVAGDKSRFERGVVPAGAKMSYEEAYRAVPYRYQEYRANPGYRHDAALELMFGQLRPMTVVRPAYGPQVSTTVNVWPGYNWFHPPYSLFAGPLY